MSCGLPAGNVGFMRPDGTDRTAQHHAFFMSGGCTRALLEEVLRLRERVEELERADPVPALDPDEDRCPHGMFYSGAGACPKCGEPE